MPLTIAPFTDGDLDEAATLLAVRHRTDRQQEPDFPARFEEADAARAFLAAAWAAPMTSGVVARRDGRLRGYVVGSIVLPQPTSAAALFIAPRSVQIVDAGYAAEPEEAVDLYRALYAALAPAWLGAGCFTHYVSVRRCDPLALEGWSSLGFARQMVNGVRDVGPLDAAGAAGAAGDVSIARAGSEDLAALLPLVIGNLRYHGGPPVFDPYFPETEPELRTDLERLLGEPDARPVWLAQRGRAIGAVNLVPPRRRMITPARAIHLQHGYTDPEARGGGVATALLAEALAWARDAGHEHCTINWHTANLLGARFWQRSGFRPVGYGLVRTIDARIAWAR